MLEELRELLRKKKEVVVKDMETKVVEQVEDAKKDVENYFDALEKTARIVLPVNLLDILTEGGYVSVGKIHATPHRYIGEVRLHCELNHDVVVNEEITLEGNQDYRIVVIVEKLLGEKKEE